MNYINTSSGAYPVSESEIRAAHPNTSFPAPFLPPEGYALVFPAPAPAHNSATHATREIAPELTALGHYEQRWAVTQLPQEQITENYAALRQSRMDAVTALRWEKETGGLILPNGVKIATATADQNRITTVIANAQLAGVSAVDFKAATGWVTLTIAEVQGIAAAIALHVQACFSAERAHHEAIAGMAAADLKTYDISTGWPV